MPHFVCNKKIDDKGRHEVHEINCSFLPNPENRIDIGYKINCHEAIQKMEEWNPTGFNFDGCYYCCYSCHKG